MVCLHHGVIELGFDMKLNDLKAYSLSLSCWEYLLSPCWFSNSDNFCDIFLQLN
jgi:hypothetical protein